MARRVKLIGALVVLWLANMAAIFGSSSRIVESTFNAAGHPAAGVVPASTSFRITLDGLGDNVAGTAMSSVSHRIQGGWSSAFPPPGTVSGVRFASPSKELLTWDPERSAGTYGVYRGLLSGLAPGPAAYGDCLDFGFAGTSITDTAVPPAGDGFFYLVTVANRLYEEGTTNVEGTNGSVERPLSCSDSCYCRPATCPGGCNP